MLQAALLLLSYAVSNHLFPINKVVTSVLIGFTSFCLLFYPILSRRHPFLQLPVPNAPLPHSSLFDPLRR